MRKFFGRLVRDEQGVTSIEYAVIAAAIVAIIIAAMAILGPGMSSAFTNIVASL